ncbi:thioredoxin family protein [Flavobacterium sp.]|jgi:protein disulfide-isomerase|uniref:thioredoxin family protein n=1 Tax=Flavobacterium sp. TaxID=239 RepID=UPI0037C081AD
MKKIILLLLFVSSLTINAQELTWHTDVNKASELAIKNKKPLMLFFTGSDWCGWCIKLQKEVFKTPEFVKWATENVILVELDFPRRKQLAPELLQQNKNLEQMFAVRGYPTVWFVTPALVDGKMTFNRLGSTGYVANGPQGWLPGAKQILANK